MLVKNHLVYFTSEIRSSKENRKLEQRIIHKVRTAKIDENYIRKNDVL